MWFLLPKRGRLSLQLVRLVLGVRVFFRGAVVAGGVCKVPIGALKVV